MGPGAPRASGGRGGLVLGGGSRRPTAGAVLPRSHGAALPGTTRGGAPGVALAGDHRHWAPAFAVGAAGGPVAVGDAEHRLGGAHGAAVLDGVGPGPVVEDVPGDAVPVANGHPVPTRRRLSRGRLAACVRTADMGPTPLGMGRGTRRPRDGLTRRLAAGGRMAHGGSARRISRSMSGTGMTWSRPSGQRTWRPSMRCAVPSPRWTGSSLWER